MEIKLDEFLEAGKILIADGATGTMLMAAGTPCGDDSRVMECGRARKDPGAPSCLS